MNNEELIDVKTLRPFRRFIYTIGELPSSYLMSMTYEEQLIWFCNYLEKTVIPTINNNGLAVEELQAKYIELKNYVDQYFDNLDVQEEINNKLDDMAESGELTDIIAQYLQLAGVLAYDTISDMVNAENLVNGSICKTLGDITYNDGKGSFYKIRTITNDDVIDNINIIALNVSDTLIAERISNKLDNEYYFHTLFATPFYRVNNNIVGMQGGCVLPNGKIIQCTGINDQSTGYVILYNSNGTIETQREVNYGHCNSVCYCKKTNSVFITGDTDNIDPYKIYEINPSTLSEVAVYDIEDKNFPDYVYGMQYDDINDKFIFCNNWVSTCYMWTTDTSFNLITTKELNYNLFSLGGIGKFNKYIAMLNISNNHILLFDYNLTFIKDVILNDLISDTWHLSEIEWLDSIDNIIYLGFNPISTTSPNWGGGVKCYATCDIYNNYEETIQKTNRYVPYDEVYYVDPEANYNPLRNGTQNAPFSNIMEAINASLRQKNVTGEVTIHLVHDETNNYLPLFTMKKNYRIYCSETIHAFSNIFIDNPSSVYISNAVVLTGNNYNGLNPLNMGNCHICNRGTLICEKSISMETGTNKVMIAASSTSVTKFVLTSGGLDLSGNFNGYFENLGTDNFTDNNLISLGTFTSWSRIIKNVRNTLTATGTNTYTIPKLNETMLLVVRFTLPFGGSTTSVERVIPIISGNYSSDIINFQTNDNVNRIVSVTYDGNQTVTLGGYLTAASQIRVKCYS